MTWTTLFRRACQAAVIFAALAAATRVPAAAAESVFRAIPDYCAEVNGTYAPDARFFSPATKGKLLVELPSLSMSVLINNKTGKVVTVPSSSMKHESGDSVVRLADPIPQDAAVYALSIDGPNLAFRVETSEVRVLRASDCQPNVAPAWTAAPITDDPAARKCLHQDAKPLTSMAGCMKGAYLRNSCEGPVTAVVLSTQYLSSGTLPETSSIVLPPGTDHLLGCVWFSGAMAPTVYEVRAAAFLRR